MPVDEPPRRPVWRSIARVLAVLVVGASGIAACRWERARFDAERWQQGAGEERESNPRQWMAEGVRLRLLAERPTRAEVHALLGEPDFGNGETWDAWCIGCEGAHFGPRDGLSLNVGFNPDHRVEAVRICK